LPLSSKVRLMTSRRDIEFHFNKANCVSSRRRYVFNNKCIAFGRKLSRLQMLGSILSNILLVLGCSFLAG
jgi:hypothetical protein